jgi:hypothetical protein
MVMLTSVIFTVLLLYRKSAQHFRMGASQLLSLSLRERAG